MPRFRTFEDVEQWSPFIAEKGYEAGIRGEPDDPPYSGTQAEAWSVAWDAGNCDRGHAAPDVDRQRESERPIE